jgi:hypothetical protein
MANAAVTVVFATPVLTIGVVFGQRTFASCNNDSYKQQITSIGMLSYMLIPRADSCVCVV